MGAMSLPKWPWVVTAGLALVSSVTPGIQPGAQLSAQQLVAASVTSPLPPALVPQERRKIPVLETSLTLNITEMSLASALEETGRVARVPIIYSKAVLPAGKTVSFSGVNVTLRDVLSKILTGTELATEVTPEGQVVVTQRKEIAKAAEGWVAGKVINAKTKLPLTGVRITLGEETKGVTTGEAGDFRLAAPAGEQVLHVRGLGFVRLSRRVTIPADGTVTVEIALEPSTNVLNEVVVTGTVVATERKAIPTPITVITSEELDRRGITRIDQLMRGEIPGLFAAEKGANTYSDGRLGAMASVDIFSRGVSQIPEGRVAETKPNPIKTYVDGVELLDASYLGTLDPRSIERIEVITGPQAATIYGSGALGGVMQIFTKKGDGTGRTDLTVRTMYGILQNNLSDGLTPSHNHSATVTGGTASHFTYSGSMSYRYTGQWQPALFNQMYGGSVGAGYTTGPLRVDGSVSLTHGKNGTASGDLGVMVRRSTGEYWTGNLAGYFSQRVSTSSSQMLSLNLSYRQAESWQHHVTMGRAQNAFELVPSAPQYETAMDTLYASQGSTGQRITLGYNTTLTAPSSWPLMSTLTLGANGSIANQTRVDGCLATSTSTSYIGCQTSSRPYVDKLLNSDSWGGFGSWQVGLFDKVFLTLGLRAERNPSYGDAHKIDWTPTNGMTFTANWGDLTVKLMGSYGRATRAPDPSWKLQQISRSAAYDPPEYISRFGNPGLTPEHEQGPQGGFEIYYGNAGSWTLNYYAQTVNNLVRNLPIDSILRTQLSNGAQSYARQMQYVNVAKIKKYGWESTATLNVGPLIMKAAYSWNENRILDMGKILQSSYFYTGRSLSLGIPTHIGSVQAGYARGNTNVTVVANFMGKATRSTDVLWASETGFSPYIRLDIDKPTTGVGPRDWVTGGYTKADVSITHRLTPTLSGNVNITNVGNSYAGETTIAYPTLGRQTLVGISWKML